MRTGTGRRAAQTTSGTPTVPEVLRVCRLSVFEASCFVLLSRLNGLPWARYVDVWMPRICGPSPRGTIWQGLCWNVGCSLHHPALFLTAGGLRAPELRAPLPGETSIQRTANVVTGCRPLLTSTPSLWARARSD